jgi:hypothetical protein
MSSGRTTVSVIRPAIFFPGPAIAAYLQPARTRDENVNRQIAWFSEQLVLAIGGHDALNRAIEDLGL